MKYPHATDPNKVGTYPASVKSGGGYVWDTVLEYRVWLHPELGAEDIFDGDDYFYAFESHKEALKFSSSVKGTEQPLVLVFQQEYIDEPEPETYQLVRQERITEWDPAWLSRSKRDEKTVTLFFENPIPDRLDLLRQ
ncbi:GCN5 family acetyltransferase [Lewinella sp. 4G2]|uniref:GCN5 family acetyltransferase n=1 Tax=Lewinella sp. 4G2 TaxID=1803372 RepID=UPI0007B4E00B|nr:GCN5 family acetyltransferase [Lewinella sp. 4G2]OAV46251.1 GCN5 family acetyltransferase [Lewinella sp. 4G2]